MDRSKLSIGTAQLGSNYGIAFSGEKITTEEFSKIMVVAKNHGISSLDTAIGYGDSQTILGNIGVKNWSVTTKLPPIPARIDNLEVWYQEAIQSLFSELQVSSIETLLLHNAGDLVGTHGPHLSLLLLESRRSGLVKNIGVSIYEPEELSRFYNEFQPDVVQCPFNIFDQRILNSGWLRRLKDDGVEIHARSVFLQGIILRDPAELHSYFSPWGKDFLTWSNFCEAEGVTKLEAALYFVKCEAKIDKIIVGIEGLDQFEEVLKAYDKNFLEVFQGSCEDKGLVNPLMWRIG